MNEQIYYEIDKLVKENAHLVAQDIMDRYKDISESAIIDFAHTIASTYFMDYPDYDIDEPITEIPEALAILFSDYTEEIDSCDLYDYFDKLGNIFL